MAEELKQKLIFLANRYEVSSFCEQDPSQFLRWYPKTQICDVECASFIAAMLSFGNRTQFIPKIKFILELADKTSGSITNWIKNDCPNFPSGPKKFYRFYSYDDLVIFFGELKQVFINNVPCGQFSKINYSGRCGVSPLEGLAEESLLSGDKGRLSLPRMISEFFSKSKIVPKGKNSANKRIHMFLRWMVRQNSSVDLGIWDWYDQKNLIIPLDTHVLQEAKKLGLLEENDGANIKSAIKLTDKMSQIFIDDPARADFALFGLGVDERNEY